MRITEPRTRHGALTVLWYKGTLGRARGRGRRAAPGGRDRAVTFQQSQRLSAVLVVCVLPHGFVQYGKAALWRS